MTRHSCIESHLSLEHRESQACQLTDRINYRRQASDKTPPLHQGLKVFAVVPCNEINPLDNINFAIGLIGGFVTFLLILGFFLAGA